MKRRQNRKSKQPRNRTASRKCRVLKSPTRVGTISQSIPTLRDPQPVPTSDLRGTNAPGTRPASDGEGVLANAVRHAKKMRDAERERVNSLVDSELKRLSSVHEAKRPIAVLVRRGADLRQIVELLTAVYRREKGHSEDIYRIPGLLPKDIRNLPTRCEVLATQIEAIDREIHQAFFHLRFKHLPTELRSYALNISAKLNAKTSHKGRYIRPDTAPKLKLIRYISNSTGRAHYEILAQLIRAYFSMKEIRAKCSASSLKMLLHDHQDGPAVNR